MTHRALTFMIIIAAATMHSSVRADGDTRQATKAEMDFTLKVYQTISQALPPMPSGWLIKDRTAVVADSFVTVGTENQPMNLEFTLEAEDSAKITESEQRISQFMQTYSMAHQEETQQMIDSAAPKIEALQKRMNEAITKGDMVQLEKIQSELIAIQAPIAEKSDSLQEEINQQTAKFKAKDAKVWILVAVNGEYEDVNGYKEENPIAGNQTFWHSFPADDNPDYEGEIMTFIGAWKLKQEDGNQYMGTTWNLGLPHTVVQNMVIQIQGDKTRAQKIIESINWELMKKLFMTN